MIHKKQQLQSYDKYLCIMIYLNISLKYTYYYIVNYMISNINQLHSMNYLNDILYTDIL